MITLDTPTQTLHDSGIVAECGLFQLDFSAAAGGTQRIALWPVDIVSGATPGVAWAMPSSRRPLKPALTPAAG